MNGPEHYRKAEWFAQLSSEAKPDHALYLVALAQVHATLALTASTAMSTIAKNIPSSYQLDEWADVIGWTRHGLTPEEEAAEQRAAPGAGEPHDPF